MSQHTACSPDCEVCSPKRNFGDELVHEILFEGSKRCLAEVYTLLEGIEPTGVGVKLTLPSGASAEFDLRVRVNGQLPLPANIEASGDVACAKLREMGFKIENRDSRPWA